MEAFRNLIRGKFGKVLLVLFLVPFALFGVDGIYRNLTTAEPVVAKIAGQKIYANALDNSVREQKQQLLERVGNDESRIDTEVLKQKVLDNMISRTALLAQANKLKLSLSDQQIVAIIQQQTELQTNGVFDNEKYKAFLISKRMDSAQFINSLREDLTLKQLMGGLSFSAIATNREIDTVVIAQDEKRHTLQATLPLDKYLDTATVTPAAINSYYTEHKAQLRTGENADIDYVVLESNRFNDQASAVSDTELNDHYQAFLKTRNADTQVHTQLILIPVDSTTTDSAASTLAATIESKIKAGEDFANLAKQYSKDPASAPNGGDLGKQSINYFDFDPPIKSALQNMQAGQVSAPIKGNSGYAIIKMLDKSVTSAPSLESMKAQFSNEIRLTKASNAYQDAVTKINEAAVTTDKIVDIAKDNGLSVTRIPAFSKRNAVGDFANRDFLASVFSTESTEDRKIVSGVALNDNKTIWAQVTAYHPAREKNLQEASAEITFLLKQGEAMKQAKLTADAVVKALNSGSSIAQVSQQYGVTFNDLGEIKRDNALSAEVTSTAFALATPSAGKLTANVVKINPSKPSNVVVVAVNSVTPGQLASMKDDDRKNLVRMYAQNTSQQELSDYIQFLKSSFNAKVTNQKVAH